MDNLESEIKINRIDRLISAQEHSTDKDNTEAIHQNENLRPQKFIDYPGQEHVKENLQVYVQASQKRGSVLDHVILHGPPGLGKTTLAHILAQELGVPFYNTSGPSIDKAGDLAGILAGMEAGSLLFIDEIHRLSVQVEEVLYSAMEDFSMDVVVGQGPTARSVSIPVSPFTLVGATTRLSSLSRPFLSRFGIQEKLEYYHPESLKKIILRSADIMGLSIDLEAALALAKRSRGTPRIANRLLRRVSDFSFVENKSSIDQKTVEYALNRLDIDSEGLDRTDRSILNIIQNNYAGGPVGIETISVTLGEERATVEEVYEPFLVHMGFITRSPRGRSISIKGVEQLNSR